MKLRDLCELIVLAALWGASFLFMRVATPEFGAIPLIEVRTAIAALFLLPLLALSRKGGQVVANWRAIFVLGVIGTALPFSLLAFATLFVTAGYASILNATVPMFGAIVTYFWLGDRISMSGFIGLLVGFFGVFILVLDQGSVDAELQLLPIGAALIATFLYGVGATYTKKRFSQVDALALATGSQLSAAIFLLPLAVILWPEQLPSASAWMDVLILGVACTGIAFILFFRLIANIGPAKTMTVAYMIPVFGLFWGWVFLGETMTMHMLLGGGFVLLGVGLTTGVLKLPRKQGAVALSK